MNAIQVQCGHCKRRFAAKPYLAGKRVKCPGCKNPIVIPEPDVITSIEVTCRSCSADFLAESTDVGKRIACPSCGALAQVTAGQSDVSFSAAESSSSADSLFDATAGRSPWKEAAVPGASAGRSQSTVAPRPKTLSNLPSSRLFAGKSSSSVLADHWPAGVVLLVALVCLVLCLLGGYGIAGSVSLLIGLAVATANFLVPPPKQYKSAGPGAMVASLVVGAVLMVIAVGIAIVGGSFIPSADLESGDSLGAMVVGLLETVVLSGAVVLFVFMVIRMGIARAASVIYGGLGLVAALLLVVSFFAADPGMRRSVASGPGSGPGGGPGSSVSGTSSSSAQGTPTNSTQRSKPLAPVVFPNLGSARTIAPGVDFYEVRLRVPSGQPGYSSKLYVYVPQGSHDPKSLPCVFIAGAGAYPFTGMILAQSDQAEHIPYAREGFIVVAYEIDGHLADSENATDAQYLQATRDYRASAAGVINARNAIDFALAKVSAVDPQRLYTAGHSSAGTQALLLAENDARIRACIAFAPVVDVATRLGSDLDVYRTLVNDLDGLIRRASPKVQESRLRCPVFLFHARDDAVVPVSESTDLAGRLQAAGGVVELVTVPRGGHYEPMISDGIPRAIQWLRGIAGGTSTAGLAMADPATTDPAVDSSKAEGPMMSDSGMSDSKEGSSKMDELADTRPTEAGTGGFESDPFNESPFKPSTKSADSKNADTKSADSPAETMAADSSSDESPFKASPFGAAERDSSSADAGPGSFEERAIQRLLDKIASSSGFARRDAIKDIGQIDPASVASEATKKAIVEQLNDLVLGDDHLARPEAVKALATWGDSSSVNILLGVLADKGNRSLNKDIYKVLGRLKDPASALVVAERLGDFFDGDAAEVCLRQMGPVAEDALMLVAQTTNKKLCLRAVKLLGDVGSEKCFTVLRQATRVRDVEIREAGKFAIKKIRLRQQAATNDSSADE